MDKELSAIRDAWLNRPAAGEASSSDDGTSLAEKDTSVYARADKYVAAHADQFKGWDSMPLDLIVGALEKARESGDEAAEWKYQTYLFHRFEPQQIGGTYHATVRQANG